MGAQTHTHMCIENDDDDDDEKEDDDDDDDDDVSFEDEWRITKWKKPTN